MFLSAGNCALNYPPPCRAISNKKRRPKAPSLLGNHSSTDCPLVHHHRDRLLGHRRARRLFHRPCRDLHGLGRRRDHRPMTGRGALDGRDNHGAADCGNQGCRDSGCHPSHSPADDPAGNSVAPEAARNSALAVASNSAPAAPNSSVAVAPRRGAAPGNNWNDSRCRRNRFQWRHRWSAALSPVTNSSRNPYSNLQDPQPAKRGARFVDTWRPPGPR